MIYLHFNFRSIIEPIRNTIFRETDHFHLSSATDVDLNNQAVKCQSVLKEDLTYEVPFDHLVIGVGAVSNTFGVPGVEEHAFFLKVILDMFKLYTFKPVCAQKCPHLIHEHCIILTINLANCQTSCHCAS